MQKKQSFGHPAQKAFMELVRCGISGATPDESLFRPLSAEDWNSIYAMARRQTVCGICYDAYCRLPDSLLPPGSLLPRWVARVDAIETSGRAMSEAVAALVAMLRCKGLHPVVQKGLSVARFYPTPDLRECGDIDLWLPRNEMKQAIRLARTIDPDIHSHPDGSRSFIFRGFVVELHRRLINISRPLTARNLEQFAKRRSDSSIGNTTDAIPSPTPLLELLLINVHIMHHVFGTGIGLRHLCDYMCAAYALKGQYNPAEFEEACAILGISRWTALLNNFLIEYLHADAEMLPPARPRKGTTIAPATLMNIIDEGGNFGHHPLGADTAAGPAARGKFHTLSMFLKRSRFAASAAPAEAFWHFVRLLIGQIH